MNEKTGLDLDLDLNLDLTLTLTLTLNLTLTPTLGVNQAGPGCRLSSTTVLDAIG